MAEDLDLAVLFVHHTRKSQQNAGGNWKERILGSQGLTATINTLLMIEAEKEDQVLHIAGRDVGAQDLQVSRSGLAWTCHELPHVDKPRLTIIRNP